jgi:hypothetical protein
MKLAEYHRPSDKNLLPMRRDCSHRQHAALTSAQSSRPACIPEGET